MSTLANAIDAIPIVQTTAERTSLFATPQVNQRVHNLETGNIERFDSSLGWVTSALGGVDTGEMRSTSTSNVTLWSATLEDEGAYWIVAEVIGKLSGSAQSGGFTVSCLAYRNGAGAVVQDSVVITVITASFAGVVAFDASGNDVRLRVNSGGSANYDWVANVTVTQMVGELA